MKWALFLLFVAVWVAIGVVAGPVAQTRAFGVYWMLAAAWAVFVKEVPFHLGNVEVVRLRGWAKVFVVVPVLAIGVLVTLHAQELTCLSSKYRHLCAGTARP